MALMTTAAPNTGIAAYFPLTRNLHLENEVLIHDQFYSDDDAFLGYCLQREGVGSDRTSSQKHRFKSRFIDRSRTASAIESLNRKLDLKGVDQTRHFVKIDLKSKALFFFFHVSVHAHHEVKMPNRAQLPIHLEPHNSVNVVVIIKPVKHLLCVLLKIKFFFAAAKHL